jgi:hypothetical protein
MVVNFKAREINRGACKLTQTFTLIIIKKTRLDSHVPLPDTHCQLFKKKYLVEKSSIKKKNK